ncbi:MAG: hypothetical protein AAFR77_12975 [Cyanobacteria bacterium J06631_2]
MIALSPQQTAPRRNLNLKQNQWSLGQILPLEHQIQPQYLIDAPTVVLDNFCLMLSRDVYSEGDSQILYDYLMSRRADLNNDFLTMLDLWLEDELKHYEALRRTYHCLAKVSYQEMSDRFEQRVHDFAPIQTLLKDEFTILVTLMFDEIGSVYSYRRDIREYYRHFGSEIKQIGHHLVKDEGSHFNNAAELLLLHHSHRLQEVSQLLIEIVGLEHSLGKYHQAFFLDHAQEQHRFPPNFNQLISQVVLARLGLERSPKQADLRQLWQWTPDGQNLTPV